jgi:hypothetical protein
LKQKQAKLDAKVSQVMDQQETADQAGEGSLSEACRSEQEKVHEQITCVETQAVRIEAF